MFWRVSFDKNFPGAKNQSALKGGLDGPQPTHCSTVDHLLGWVGCRGKLIDLSIVKNQVYFSITGIPVLTSYTHLFSQAFRSFASPWAPTNIIQLLGNRFMYNSSLSPKGRIWYIEPVLHWWVPIRFVVLKQSVTPFLMTYSVRSCLNAFIGLTSQSIFLVFIFLEIQILHFTSKIIWNYY